MPLADETVVRTILQPYEAKLSAAAAGAWDDWKALPLAGQLLFPGRSRACLVFDFFIRRAIAAFDGDSNVYVLRRDETAKFIFGGEVVLRFKKADESGLGSNIQTQATLKFVDQEQQLPGMPDVHKVELVYMLNRLQTQIDEIAVVARDGSMCLWSYLLTPAASAFAVIPLPLVDAVEPVRAKVKVKHVDTGQKKEARD
jgi:hypothetical protein